LADKHASKATSLRKQGHAKQKDQDVKAKEAKRLAAETAETAGLSKEAGRRPGKQDARK